MSQEAPGTEAQLAGVVTRVAWRSADGDFAIVRLEVEGRPTPVTVLGPVGELQPGEQVRIEGVWESHPVHGAQLRARTAVLDVPRTAEGVSRYLEGIPGLGPALARRLVTSFGTQALEVLEREPWRAAQVKGVGKKRAEAVAAVVAERAREREGMVFLQGLGISGAFARRIRKAWGDQAVQKLRSNPYRLAREVPGIGFFTADRIARAMGIDPRSPLRLQAGLLHVLGLFADEGHTWAPRSELLPRAAEVLDCPVEEAEHALATLRHEGHVIVEESAVFLPWLQRAESDAAERLMALLSEPGRPPPELARAARAGLDAPLPGVIVEGPPLAAGQRRAVLLSATSTVLVITGGPGTGKTTIVRTLVRAWEGGGRRVLLAAPTGRAAKRLSEATRRPAQTLHRLLEWGRAREAGAPGPFGRHLGRPLECDLLVVDESSMLDVALFRAVVDAVPAGATLCLVGDVDQLPSVGPGRVLADVIASGIVPTARLTEIFRQAEGSGITENAYRVLAGDVPVGAARAEEPSDFYVIPVEEPERARELVVRVVKERIPKAFGLDPVRDVQVLSPMHRGPAGTEELNRALQEQLNPATPGRAELVDGGRRLRVGDKVMQVRNDYDRDVFNGDVGVVVDVEAPDEDAPSLVVDFDGRRVLYGPEDLGALELAYAISVHKSQGSEYPAVVIPLNLSHWVLLRRNLVYTAITRGKRLVVLVAAARALRRAVEEAEAGQRWTSLGRRLTALGATIKGAMPERGGPEGPA